MNKDELKIKLQELQDKHDLDRKEVFREYALSNNPYKVDDIISDHICTIQIKRILVRINWDEAQCLYSGIQLDKKGNPTKRQRDTTIYQSNIKTK